MIKFRLMFLAILLVAGGCQMHEESTKNNENNNAEQAKPLTRGNVTTEEGQKAAARLEKLAKEVPKVNNAQAVVLGNYAIVAIDVDENLDRSQVGSIKYTVSEAFQNEPYGKNALIVADPDVKARLKEIGNDITAGKPLSGILNELSDITARIIPQVPGNIEQPNDNETNNNKQPMPTNEKNELKNEQQNQSNDKMKE